MARGGIPLNEWSGSGATDRLREAITEYQATADRQAETMIRLTRAILVLTAVLVIGLAV